MVILSFLAFLLFGGTAEARTSSSSAAIERAERVEIEKTLAIIRRGGPFPHAKDGATFGNRERLLPKKPHGYYREYTVTTPRARNRGARRIVRGRGGETWYTRDHYRTFIRLPES